MSNGTPTVEPSTDEVIELLKRTSLPTVIVEGKDDAIVYRRLDDFYFDAGLSVLPVGGRDKVLELFNRRSEIPKNKKIAFIADQDSWVVIGIPSSYIDNRLIFTNGYSIENDIYIDGRFEDYLDRNEKIRFSSEIEDFIRWYALAFNRFIRGENEILDHHPNRILDNTAEKEKLMTLKQGEVYPEELFWTLSENYKTLIRGKSLINLIIRHLSYKGRHAKHHDSTLIETAAVNRGDLLNSIYERVGSALGIHQLN